MSDNRTDLPSPNAPNFNQRLRETIQTYLGKQGNPLDRGLTLRDLIDTGVLKIREGFQLKPGIGGAVPLQPGDGVVDVYEPDLTPPPTPTGFIATAAISHIIVEHDAPLYTQGHGHLRTRLYGKIVNIGDPLPTFADAVEIAQFDGTVYAHPSNPATTWRLWIKWETVDGVLSTAPAGGTNGVEAITGQDVSKLVLAMTGPGNPFKVVTEQLTLPDGSVVPPGTYTADAFIHNGQIANAMIANLAVDNAKIANLSASKITAGSIGVGDFIQSTGYIAGSTGWRINGNGNAEFSNATVRGTVYATNGQFWGTVLGGAASSYSSGLGFYAGGGTTTDGASYRWRVGSPTGARIQWNGSAVEVYNASNQLTISSGGISASYVTGLGDFATLDQITSANISTYIASAAIGNAYISDLNATKINAGTISADRLDANIISAKVANIETLQISGNAVVIPVAQTWVGTYSTGAEFTITLAISGLGAEESVPVQVSIGAVAAGGSGIFSSWFDGVQKGNDLVPSASRAYVGFSSNAGNGTHTIKVKLESWSSQDTRISIIAQVIKR